MARTAPFHGVNRSSILRGSANLFMQPLIKAILWDIGGVLYTVNFTVVHKEASLRLNLPEQTIGDLYEKYRTEFLLGKKSLGEIINAEFGERNDIKEVFAQVMQEQTIFHAEVINLIDNLRQHVKQIAFTNLTENRATFDSNNHIFDHFDSVMLSYKIGLKKPDPRFFEYACEKLSLEPKNVLLIDDRQKNIDSALSFGMSAIRYENPDQLKSSLQGLQFDS